MRWRAPRFTLLLSGLVAAAALVIVLAGGGRPSRPRAGPPLQIGSIGHAQACMSTDATARATARGIVAFTGTATVPVRVTETAVGPRAAVTVTRGGNFTASVRASRHLSVTDRAVARDRVCARGASRTAARGLALRRAYAIARLRAGQRAAAGAQRALRALEHRVYPLVRSAARAAAGRRAQALALAARPALIRTARRQAARRARHA
jgi:hypothetical protein